MRQEVAAAFLHGVEFAFPEGKGNVRVSPLMLRMKSTTMISTASGLSRLTCKIVASEEDLALRAPSVPFSQRREETGE
jgi:hypothetical protein